MSCVLCGSGRQAELTAEMLIHFPGLKNIDKPAVWLFPRLTVCLDCGFSRFTVPETALASIANGLVDKSVTLKDSADGVALSIAFLTGKV
jgi:hypothetical protein